jgi:tRNA pseudouridine55 synthase
MARRKNKGRSVNGVLLLDKPPGISSNKALQKVKHLYRASKAGHTGSLDPLATGMLPVCFGEATKISAFLLDADKHYRFSCQLGVTTDTGDAEGEVTNTQDYSGITAADIERLLPDFTGEIEQIPPMYSALKHEGQRLYKLAREGIVVERKPRAVTIYKIKLHALSQGIMDLEVTCSKGTYVRTLAEEIGERLGCGAHVSQLRRLSVGVFHGEMITIDKLEELAHGSTKPVLSSPKGSPRTEGAQQALDELLLPIDSGVADWPDVRLGADAAFYMSQGQSILVPHAPTQGWVRIYDQQRFMGVGEIQDDGRVAPRRMIQSNA